MDTIADNLSEIYQYKHDIKDAINAKGGNVGNEFDTYADAIRNLTDAHPLYPVDLKGGYVSLGGSTFSILPQEIQNYAWENVSFLDGMFYACSNLQRATINGLNNVTDLWRAFEDCRSLSYVELNGLAKCHGMNSTFSNCTSLKEVHIGGLTALNPGVQSTFIKCTSLQDLYIGSLWTGKVPSSPVMNYDFGLSYCTKLSHDSIVRLISVLPDCTGVTGNHVLTLGTTNINKLTASEKAVATNKNWSLL